MLAAAKSCSIMAAGQLTCLQRTSCFGIGQQQPSGLNHRYKTCLQGPCSDQPSEQERKEEAEWQCGKALLEARSTLVIGAYSLKRFLFLDSSNRRNELFDHASHGGVELHSDYHGQHLVFGILGIPHLCIQKTAPAQDLVGSVPGTLCTLLASKQKQQHQQKQ